MSNQFFTLPNYDRPWRIALIIVATLCTGGAVSGQTMPELATFPEGVYELDQGVRRELMGATDSMSFEEAIDIYREEMERIDEANLDTMLGIWRKYGWLSPDQVGGKGAHAQWLVVQHAPLEIQLEYVSAMKKAAEKGGLRKSNLATFLDRVNLRQGLHQTYGSRIGYGPDGQAYISPVKDPENLNELREEMDMSTIEEYAEKMSIQWNLQNYVDSLTIYRVWEWGSQ